MMPTESPTAREDVIYRRWLAAGAPGGKPATRRYAGQVLAGANPHTRGHVVDVDARADFAQLRGGVGGHSIRDDGTFGPIPVDLLVDQAEASAFRDWVAAGLPGVELEVQAAGRRLSNGGGISDEAGSKIANSWRRLRSFEPTDTVRFGRWLERGCPTATESARRAATRLRTGSAPHLSDKRHVGESWWAVRNFVTADGAVA